jgi:hypothetical protein
MSNELTDGQEVAIGIAALFGVIIGALILGFGGFLYGVFVAGFVGMKLWAWYIVPVFGLKALTIVQAWGIALLASLWTHQFFTNTNKDERSDGEKIAYFLAMFASPWLTLLFGWIGHAYLM